MRIELKQVTKLLGGTTVLDSLDLVLEDSQIVVVLGANGAGKTTLLHLLGGLYRTSAGEVLLDGEPLQRQRLDQRRRLHYLPDIPVLPPGQTPLDYIAFAAEAYDRTSTVTDRKIVELLDEFDMLPIADCPSRSLSRGQRYKATLIGMIAVDPELWILDEPFTSGVDPLGLSAMRTHLLAARNRGRLVVYSTQLIELAQQISDNVCVLSDARIAAFDSAGSLRSSAEHSDQLNRLLEHLSGENARVEYSEKAERDAESR